MGPQFAFLGPVLAPRRLISIPRVQRTSSLSSTRCCTLVGLEGAANVLRQLNASHVKELAVLMSNFGKQKYALDVLTSVQATQLDENGLSIEAVLCDGEGCVATMEVLSWPGQVRVAHLDEALQKLREMVDGAGLDGAKVLDTETVL